MKSKYKDDILRLRAEGKTYREIGKTIGASNATIAYHCAEGQKEKHDNRKRKYRNSRHPYEIKLETFSYKKINLNYKIEAKSSIETILYNKVYKFQKNDNGEKMTFTFEDVLAKFGDNPKCYLTGDYIDIYDTKSYQFDHIVPASKGGKNTLDNLGICTREANMSKSNHTLEEFYTLCEKILKTRDSKNIKVEPN